MSEDIVFEADYAEPPEVVWRVIATKEGLDSWFMDNDFNRAEVGHEFRFTARPRAFWNGICDCRVLEADAPHRFALLWNFKQDKQPTTVSWTLSRTASGGTHVLFRHTGFNGFMGLVMKRGMEKGWGTKVKHTIPFVAAGFATGRVPPRAEVDALGKRMHNAKSAT